MTCVNFVATDMMRLHPHLETLRRWCGGSYYTEDQSKAPFSNQYPLRDISGSQDFVAKPSTARDLRNNSHMESDLDKPTSRTGGRSRARGTTSGHHQNKHPLGTGCTCGESQAQRRLQVPKCLPNKPSFLWLFCDFWLRVMPT